MVTVSTGVQPNGRVIYYADAPPALATDLGGTLAQAGDMVIYTSVTPSLGAPYGWVCTAGGAIGTWLQVGDIKSTSGVVANAGVLTLHGTPVSVLPAQGAGTIIEVISLVLENQFLTGAFTGGSAIGLYYGTSASGVLASATAASTFLTSPTANEIILLAGALGANLSSAVLNTGLVLTAASTEFAAGGGALAYRLRYRLHTGL
jgi:hypothetical protein